MKERPILFSGPMVRAIIEGRKTVTRRVMKPQPIRNDHGFMRWESKGVLITDQNTAWEPFDERFPEAIRDGLLWLCPYGQPGDRLWVRETWSVEMLAGYSEEGGYSSEYVLRYRADDGDREISVAAGEPDPWLRLYDSQRGEWRPSIHMPRAACRILLEITSVRVERLQDGEGETAFESRYVAEGINRIHHGDGEYYFHPFKSEPGPGNWIDPFDAWRELWVSINGGDSWNANPWVWVVEFKRVEAGQ